MGYILGQKDSEGREVDISYGGRALRGTELKWNICERDCLAVVEAIKHYHPYISHNHFTIYSVNIALKWLQKIKDQNGRFGRWSLKLQGYDFTIEHKPGVKNQNADALSRTYHNSEQSTDTETNDQSKLHNETTSDQQVQYVQTQFEYTDEESNFISALQQIPTENEEQPALPSRQPSISSKPKTDIAKLQEQCDEVGQMYKYMVYGKLSDSKTEQQKLIISSEQYVVRDGVLYHFVDAKSKKHKRGGSPFLN